MLDPVTIIKTAGLVGVFLIIFFESAFFFGFFLPGDTLLFASGIFATQGVFSITMLILVTAFATICGYGVGYWTGKRMGRKLFERDASFFFNIQRVREAERFYKKYGPVTILISRFVPVVRTFAPIIAGVGGMNRRSFFIYSMSGGFLWTACVPLIGYYFGSLIPHIDRFLLPIVLGVVIVSLVPYLFSRIHTYFFPKKK